MPVLSTTGRSRFSGPLNRRLPLFEQTLDLVLGGVVLGVYHHAGGAVVGEPGPVAQQRVAAHVEGQTHRGDGGQSRVLVQRVEVPQPHDLVGSVRDLLAGVTGVQVAADVLVVIGHEPDAVGTQRPQLNRHSQVVALYGPVCDAP